MSAFAEDPEHFVRWVEAEGLGGADTFVPRREYRRYLEGVLAEVPGVRRVAGEAVAVEGPGALVLADGTTARLRRADPRRGQLWRAAAGAGRGAGGGRSVERGGARRRCAAMARQDKDLLLVGTGLTMIDVALTLDRRGVRRADGGGVAARAAAARRTRSRRRRLIPSNRRCGWGAGAAGAGRGAMAGGGRFAAAAYAGFVARPQPCRAEAASCATCGRGGTSTGTASRRRWRGGSRR
jgi:hypothetical protein